MKKLFIILFLSFMFIPNLANAQEKQEVYIVNVNFNSGQVSLGEVITKFGFAPSSEVDFQEFSYWIRLISFEGQVLDERMFSVNPRRMYAPLEEGEEYDGPSGEVFEKELETAVVIPYFKNGRWIELMSSNRTMIERKDIAYLSNMCGDKTCQGHESFENCPGDCPASGKDDYCDINNTEGDLDCKNIKIVKPESQEASSTVKDLEKNETNIKYYIFTGIGFIILIFIYAAYYFLVKKNDELS